MQTGEVLRRVVFNLLDAAKGGRLKKLKEVNKREIVEGVTPEYMERRIDLLLDYVKKHSPYYKKHPEWTKLEDFPVMTKGDFLEHYEEVLKMNSDEPAEPGELGRLVVTDYYNKTFPMVRYDTGDTGIMRMYQDEKGRMHGKYVEIYGRRGSLMYNCMGEPLSIHVFMNTLLKFEGVVYQAKCIQWGQKEYELLVNADRKKLVEEDLIAAYRHYLGEEAEIRITYVDEIPIQASGKFMVCENKWDGRK